MLSFILRVIYFIVGLWLVRSIVAWVGRQASRRRAGDTTNRDGTSTSRMVKDPVCGMYMDPRLAVPLENRDGTFFFCSQECRDRYVAGRQ